MKRFPLKTEIFQVQQQVCDTVLSLQAPIPTKHWKNHITSSTLNTLSECTTYQVCNEVRPLKAFTDTGCRVKSRFRVVENSWLSFRLKRIDALGLMREVSLPLNRNDNVAPCHLKCIYDTYIVFYFLHVFLY